MCGIAGILAPQSKSSRLQRTQAMMETIVHRGPDDGQYHVDDDISFGFRRLAIIDLDTGAQPMGHSNGNIWLLFNGEIYNFQQLRKTLKERGHIFRTKSDTEVIIHAYVEWGNECLNKLKGMFSLAIWDKSKNQLLLAVDRLGIKPLYYYHEGETLVFASEAKALFASELVPCEANYNTLPFHMTFLTAPFPLTMFKDVHKLEPGYFLEFQQGVLKKYQYWDCVPQEDPKKWASKTENYVAEEVKKAVISQSISDVPLGSFLSGGIDSSAVCHFLAENQDENIETYFIGFKLGDLKADVIMDERPYARQMAKDLGSVHHEIDITSEGLDTLLPKLIWHMDEPVGDPAAITTFLVSREARKTLTVLLSGVGGDEVFAGYPRHLAMNLMEKFHKLPGPVKSLSKQMGNILPGGLHPLLRSSKKFLRSVKSDELSSYLQMLSYFSPDQHRQLFTKDFYITYCKEDVYRYHREYFERCEGQPLLNKVQYVDAKTFLPCLNLTYTDRMSMAASIEVRVPLMDDDLFEDMWSLPVDQKLHARQRKYIFKKAMEPHLPHDVIWRKKSGFGAPIQAWINNELKDLVHQFLGEPHLRQQGIFNPETISRLLKSEERKEDYYANHIWQLLVFQIWHRIFITNKGRSPSLGL